MIKSTLLALCLFGLSTAHYGQEAVTSIHGIGGKTIIKTNNGFSSFNVEMRGKIELTDDDKDIKSMSPDGYLEVTKTVFGSRRTLIISSEGVGQRREYYEGRTKIPFDPAGREWMREVLPELVRSTTIGAEGRVDRFFKQGGPGAVLREIKRMESNYVKAHYANLLMKQPMNTSDYARVVNGVSSTIDSNHYLANFLQSNMAKFLKSREATEAVFEATNRMDSDHYRTEVIKEGLQDRAVSTEAVKIILHSAGQMDSDHYKTEVLTSLMRQDNLNDAVLSEMINTSKTIDSDYYRSVVLTKALEKQGLSATSFQRALESVKDIGSDHYKSEVMRSLVSKPISDDLKVQLIDLTHSISSDHYCTEVLEAMMEHQKLDDRAFDSLVKRAANIESDHYASTVMEYALSHDLSKSQLINLLNAAGRIDSDHYLSEVLMSAASQVRRSDQEVKEAYRNAARNIESETYYGRVMRSLDN